MISLPSHLFHLFVVGDSSCDASCAPGAGCLGPNSPSLCGTCRRLEDNSNTCNAVPTPPPSDNNATAIALGIIIPLLIIILVALAVLGAWGGVVLSKRWRGGKKGSFDVAVSSFISIPPLSSLPTCRCLRLIYESILQAVEHSFILLFLV